MSENNKKLDVSQLADLSALDTSKSPEIKPIETKKEEEDAGQFFNTIAGTIASVGLPEDIRQARQKEYCELAEFLGMGRYYSKVLGGKTDLDPTTGAIVMSILFIVIVILGREDARKMIAGMIVKKPVDKRQELKEKAEEKSKIAEGEYKKPPTVEEK